MPASISDGDSMESVLRSSGENTRRAIASIRHRADAFDVHANLSAAGNRVDGQIVRMGQIELQPVPGPIRQLRFAMLHRHQVDRSRRNTEIATEDVSSTTPRAAMKRLLSRSKQNRPARHRSSAERLAARSSRTLSGWSRDAFHRCTSSGDADISRADLAQL